MKPSLTSLPVPVHCLPGICNIHTTHCKCLWFNAFEITGLSLSIYLSKVLVSRSLKITISNYRISWIWHRHWWISVSTLFTKAWCSQKILHWFYNNLIELQPNCFSQLVTFKPRHFDIKWFYSHKIDKNRSTCSLLHDMNNKQIFSFNNVTVIWLWYHYTENAEIGLIQAIIDICTWHMRSSSTAWW